MLNKNRKLRVVVSYIAYPLSMASYFVRALRRRDDVDLVTVGPYTGAYIPWGGGMHIPMRHIHTPTVPLPAGLANNPGMSADIIYPQLPWDTVDLWLQVDAGWWMQKPKAGIVAHVATDPHVLNYDKQRGQCDVFFNMQEFYMKPGDRYLPYAADPILHFPMENASKEYHGCLIGLHYENRDRLVNRLRQKGYSIYYDLGAVFEEFNAMYNKALVALNWSSLNDLNARTFEAMAMGIPLLTNRVPDLSNFFVDGDHYLGFSDLDEAERQFSILINDVDFADELANNAYRKVLSGHTWDHRIETIFDVCKLA